jgi:hypothetical protein
MCSPRPSMPTASIERGRRGVPGFRVTRGWVHDAFCKTPAPRRCAKCVIFPRRGATRVAQVPPGWHLAGGISHAARHEPRSVTIHNLHSLNTLRFEAENLPCRQGSCFLGENPGRWHGAHDTLCETRGEGRHPRRSCEPESGAPVPRRCAKCVVLPLGVGRPFQPTRPVGQVVQLDNR